LSVPTQIEKQDIDPERRDDWQEVNNYVKAMNTAIDELEKLPLSSRLIRNAHKILLSSVRGEQKNPGEFRRSQNWIGGTGISDAVFIPPAHHKLPELLTDFEKFLNNNQLAIPHLIRIAIAHYQFETIHPFLDGNGRIGRLLITLYLVYSGVLYQPLLYLSDFFERHKTLYYDNLTFVRTKNDLGQWIRFFLSGVTETAENAVETLHKIIDLKTNIEKYNIIGMGKRSRKAMMLLNHLFKNPVINVKDVQAVTNLSPKAANDLVQVFIENKILKEITGYRRNRVFAFENYIKLF
jgi:Fic family protein